MRADPIPAVREDEATGHTAALFADLRATLCVPFVNLIWRHLATLPGMLEWTWTLVKPLQGSAELREAANALHGLVPIPAGLRQPACVYDVVGVTGADRATIGTMLRDYNAANAANLLGLLVAQFALSGDRGQGRAPTRSNLRDRQVEAAPTRLPGLDELPPATLALILELDTFGRFAATEAVASLYRHLGHWPGFLAIVHAGLSLPHGDGRLRDVHAGVRDRARDLARERLLPLVSDARLPNHEAADAARDALQHFTSEMIARMVVMGELMLAMLPVQGELQ